MHCQSSVWLNWEMKPFSSMFASLYGNGKHKNKMVGMKSIVRPLLYYPVAQDSHSYHRGCKRCCFQAQLVFGNYRCSPKRGMTNKLFSRRHCLKRVKLIFCRLYSASSPRVPLPSTKQGREISYDTSQDEEATLESEKRVSSSPVLEKFSPRRLGERGQNDPSAVYLTQQSYDLFEEWPQSETTDIFKELRKWLVEGPDAAFKFSFSSAVLVFIISVLLRKLLPHSSHDLIGLETMDSMFPSRQITEHLSFWEQLWRVFRGPYILVSLTMGFASFTQAFAGFGFAVVAVGVLSQFGWIVNSNVFQDIQPIAAVIGSLIGWTLIGSQWNKVHWKEIMPLLISCMVSTPLGAWGLQYVNHSVSLHILGSLIFGFVIYSFSGLQPSRKWFANRIAAWTLGGLAGIFGGAFDINGPPLVFYGQAKQWHPEEFKRNILTVISLNSSFVVLFDALCGRLNDYYIGPFLLYSVPFVAIGTYVGVTLSQKLGPKRFKQAVLATCFIMSLRLLTS
ncbi:hypothetical protein GpartN1_g6172.t1 [Galdieria partita]|uniref:Uncharacterized protein n=1 Tax=Galdieria partita TaxID=83374 RepID=A0A9C7UST8_9RHOD|nr:hypothetical protein GpartN1_g6172.t1 [Galdieria partita]